LGPVKAVILDWAGTTVDHGSLAPVRVLQEVFAKRGVPISEEEARRDMGVLKIDHIRKILFGKNVATRWNKAVGRDPTETDVETLFANFVPLQLECLVKYSTVIDGVAETVARLRNRGIKIGSTTGYTRAMLEMILHPAAAQGYAVSADRLAVPPLVIPAPVLMPPLPPGVPVSVIVRVRGVVRIVVLVVLGLSRRDCAIWTPVPPMYHRERGNATVAMPS